MYSLCHQKNNEHKLELYNHNRRFKYVFSVITLTSLMTKATRAGELLVTMVHDVCEPCKLSSDATNDAQLYRHLAVKSWQATSHVNYLIAQFPESVRLHSTPNMDKVTLSHTQK